MLQVIDGRWKDHLLDMDYLQEGIHLRALGQRDPLSEYKHEGYELFDDMLGGFKQSVVTTLLKNSPEDLAIFAAITLEQPMTALNYSSGEDLAYQTSFAGAAAAAVPEAAYEPQDDGYGAAAAQAPQNIRARSGRCAVKQRVVTEKVGPQRPLPVRLRQEVQEVSRRVRRLRSAP